MTRLLSLLESKLILFSRMGKEVPSQSMLALAAGGAVAAASLSSRSALLVSLPGSH
jgi:hypothetical protein